MEKASQYLRQLGISKNEAEQLANELANEVTEGLTDPLEIRVSMSFLEKVIKAYNAIDDVRYAEISEAEKYGGKSFEKYNAKFDVGEVGTKYIYENCNYTPLLEVSQEIENQQVKVKEYQKFLKGLQKPMADPDTGEIINPPVKLSTTKVKIQLK